MLNYGQFCPVARAAEVFGERWTPLVVRELICGSTHFNDIAAVCRGYRRRCSHNGCASWRIGVVERVRDQSWCRVPADCRGRRLRPIVLALGHWGARWMGSGLKRDQLDVGLLMWDIRRFARRELFPADRRTSCNFGSPMRVRGERVVAGRRERRGRPVPRRPGARSHADRRIERADTDGNLERRSAAGAGGGPQRGRCSAARVMRAISGAGSAELRPPRRPRFGQSITLPIDTHVALRRAGLSERARHNAITT